MDTNLNTDSKNNSGIADEIADVSNCSNVVGQTHPQYSKICESEKLKTTNIESLPDETIFDILVRVPAQNICNSTRFVCRKWYQIIRTREFIHSHLRQSTPPGLLIQKITPMSDEPIFVTTRKARIEIYNINYNFTHSVLSSCNGLILECHDKSLNLCITNPATKQHFTLPRFVSYSSTIAYAVGSMKYKLVCPFYDESKSRDEIAILTVGICDGHSSSVMDTRPFRAHPPLYTEGFVHWADREGLYVLTMNIETEIVTQFRIPECRFGDSSWYYYLSTGSHLTTLIGRAKFVWEVWEMKSETGEWTKTMIIDLESEKLSFKSGRMLIPVGWLNFGDVLVFKVYTRGAYPSIYIPDKLCIAYNVRTHEIIDSFCTPDGYNKFVDHRDSLVWLDLDGH
ncbi:hypothetical protein CASFOL_041224 [Castilleja foliolosa]|uniref:F-box domain-containing protein n=1 Tax=Castilleja foliolosa TaxID=1961234 RepID=A0ABD3BDT1_9LAMI